MLKEPLVSRENFQFHHVQRDPWRVVGCTKERGGGDERRDAGENLKTLRRVNRVFEVGK